MKFITFCIGACLAVGEPTFAARQGTTQTCSGFTEVNLASEEVAYSARDAFWAAIPADLHLTAIAAIALPVDPQTREISFVVITNEAYPAALRIWSTDTVAKKPALDPNGILLLPTRFRGFSVAVSAPGREAAH